MILVGDDACLADALEQLNDFLEVADVENWEDKADVAIMTVAVL